MMEKWQQIKTGQRQRNEQPEFVLPVDVVEGKQGFRLLCMIPGIEPDQVAVEMNGDVLTISGERRLPALAPEERLELVESHHGFFKRQFKLPERADSNSISARYEDGILEISISKKDSTPARSIPVTVAGD